MRPQKDIDYILAFRCRYCGAAAGQWCRWFARGSSRTTPMNDFHMLRTREAYQNNGSAKGN